MHEGVRHEAVPLPARLDHERLEEQLREEPLVAEGQHGDPYRDAQQQQCDGRVALQYQC